MSEDDKKEASPFDDTPNGGRYLLGGIFIAALVLLAMIRWQTVPGTMGQTAMSGGWWAEPALAPAIALCITILTAGVAFLTAAKETINWSESARTYAQVALITACMIGAVMLMKIIGFALSILVFAAVVAFIGGYRRWKLAAIAIGAMVAMVLVFRVGFAIWFPRPALFKWVDLPFWLQGLL